jgi:hypothetical protein
MKYMLQRLGIIQANKHGLPMVSESCAGAEAQRRADSDRADVEGDGGLRLVTHGAVEWQPLDAAASRNVTAREGLDG